MSKPQVLVTGDIAKFTVLGVPDRPGIAADVFGRIGDAGYKVSMMSTAGGIGGRTDFSFVVDAEAAAAVGVMLNEMSAEIGAGAIEKREDVAEVSLHGEQLSQATGIAGRMFRVLSDAGINIEMMSTGVSSVACIIDAALGDKARDALTAAFGE